KGQYNAICDVCGFMRKSGEIKLRWDGLMVCKEDWEPRQPQDFVRGVPEKQDLPWTRPPNTTLFIDPSTPIDPKDFPSGH
ncbi:MAG: hypothetical protein ACREQ5_11470, partial [Candidatus Dormibacteria bacterium]